MIYAVVMAIVQIALVSLYASVGSGDFLKITRDVGVWGILLTIVYKQTVILIMAATPDKTLLA